jgi:hypothetical protein
MYLHNPKLVVLAQCRRLQNKHEATAIAADSPQEIGVGNLMNLNKLFFSHKSHPSHHFNCQANSFYTQTNIHTDLNCADGGYPLGWDGLRTLMTPKKL